jgi:polyisoprenyl-phosphate glycosyltransferase
MWSQILAQPPLVIGGALAAVVAALLLVLLLLVRRRRTRRQASTAASSPAPTLAQVAGGHSTSSALGPTHQAAALAGRRLSVVIPCYNEYENIRPMYQRLTAVLRPLGVWYELIFVNNGSYDHSAEVFDALAAADAHVTVLTLSRNFGSQGAYTSGLEHTLGDAVVCIDGDIQDPPELIPDLVGQWLEGYDVVYGVRVRRKGSLIRRIGYKAFYRLFRRLSYVEMPVDAGDFGLMDRKVVDVLNAMPERDRFIRGLRAWAGFRQTGIPYVRDDRKFGKTSNSILELFRWAGRGIYSFSYAPLQLISYLAAGVVGLAAIALVVYTVLYFVFPDAPRGFQTLLVIVIFLGSIQLLCLSIIGSYLGKIFEEIKGRPKYVVAQIQNDHRAERHASRHVEDGVAVGER